MIVREILEKLEGQNIKIGASVSFIYCGVVKNLSKLFEQEEKKEIDRLGAELSKYSKDIKKHKKDIEKYKSDIESLSRYDIEGMSKEKIDKIIDYKKNNIKKSTQELNQATKKLNEIKMLIKDYKPIMDSEVLEVYPSKIEDATIIIFKGRYIGKYWTIKEYQEKGGRYE